MSRGLIFWVLMLIWLVFGFLVGWNQGWQVWGKDLLIFVLFLLVGWGVYGPPIKE